MDGNKNQVPESDSTTEGKRPQLRQINPYVTEFKTEKHHYVITDSLSIARYKVYQKYNIEAAFHMDFMTMFNKLEELYGLVNEMRFADAAVLINNMRLGVAKLDDAEVFAFKYCTLFINRVDEDPKVYNHSLMKDKIADWEAEGIDSSFFIVLSSRLIQGFLQVYRELSLKISQS